MRVGNRGYQDVMARMSEIESRMNAKLGAARKPEFREAVDRVSYGMRGLAGELGASKPYDPFGDSADMRALSREVAIRQGIDPLLFESLIGAESGFDPGAVSSAGAQGLAQLMPATARGLGVTDPFDPIQNLEGGARYLRQMLQRYDGDIRKALAAYNAGPGAVDRHGGVPPFDETQSYVKRIMDAYQRGDR